MAKTTRKQLARLLSEQLGDKPLKSFTAEIAAYLVAERRTAELDGLMRDIKQIRADQGIVEVDVASAFPLKDDTKAAIKTALGARKLIVNETIDQQMLGGVRVESNDTLLDLTVRSRLNKLKHANPA